LYLASVCVQLKGFEAIRGVTLDAEQFSTDNDCLTPTFKFKRPQLQKRYQVSSQHATRSREALTRDKCPDALLVACIMYWVRLVQTVNA
jgi:hypothetical protein